MSVLDLQGMEPSETVHRGQPSGSRTSKGCGVVVQSNVSLIICILVL